MRKYFIKNVRYSYPDTNKIHSAPTILASFFLLMMHTNVVYSADSLTRDIGAVRPTCNDISFITSLNNDDDNGDGQADNRRKITAGVEDNLRQFIFSHKAASKVYVAQPVLADSSNGTSSEKRVRAYSDDQQTPFEFNKEYSLPLTLYLEGTHESKTLNDFGIRYEYRGESSEVICSRTVLGTVINLTVGFDAPKGQGTDFNSYNKMLITASGTANAKIHPSGSAQIEGWRYDGTATIHKPLMSISRITAGTSITPLDMLDGHMLRFHIQQGNQGIEAYFPVNITAPMHAATVKGWIDGKPVISNWINTKKGHFTLFKKEIQYTLLDQFKQPITKSAWAGRMVQIRENIAHVIQSFLPRVQNWINTSLNWSPEWINKPKGTFTDTIEARDIFKDILLDHSTINGSRSFHPSLLKKDGLLLELGENTHNWEASVNGVRPVIITQNQFSVRTEKIREKAGRQEIRFKSSYIVKTP
ncbi:hypothetical protein [Kordiimonas sp. SCSIO 12610]|uniref:hypothetical protein n=1 Tax=Kordiimonas sp. SCSIO 12610 TaxID=2829597 RepID=UPI00210EFE02|nr:hypothetical protein [Kordiimonas sp. SCSIO 12610]UTW55956.1 hypothetical protein KFF44_03420 [Kordiimonas sp. SCSIO 12610]